MTKSIETHACRLPGCSRPAEAGDDGPGRPREYCDEPTHNRASAWRARRAGGGAPDRAIPDDMGRPVTMAAARGSELTSQVTNQGGPAARDADGPTGGIADA